MVKTWTDFVDQSVGAADLNRYEQNLPLTASIGDQAATLNSWLAAGSPMGVMKAVGSFAVSSALSVPDGTYLDLSQATITQTGSLKTTLSLGNNTTLIGGSITGLGSDYVAGASPVALGIDINGVTGVQVRGTKITNVSGASIRVYNGSSDVKISGVSIVGVGAAGRITAQDGSPCFGILVDINSHDVSIDNCDISQTCQGIEGGAAVSHLSISNTRVHDIAGQHGVYVQNGNGLNINGVDIWNCVDNGCKVQTANTVASADTIGISIAGLTTESCGDTGLVVSNATIVSGSASSLKFRAVSISGFSSNGDSRGLYLNSMSGAVITGISIYNSTHDAITLFNSDHVELSDFVVHTAGWVGLRLHTISAASTAMDRIRISDGLIYNPGNLGATGNVYGIYHIQGTNVTLDNIGVTADNSLVDYSLFVASSTAADQQTLAVRNCELIASRATLLQDVRLESGPVALKAWVNNTLGAAVVNWPTAIPVRIGGRGLGTTYSSNAAPTSGTFKVGDQVLNNTPAVGSPKSWVCTVAGSPGTWVSEGNL